MSHFVGYRKAKRLSGSEFRTSRLWKSVRGKPGRLVTKIRRPTARVTRRFAAKLRYMGDHGCARAPDCRDGRLRYGQTAATVLTETTLNFGPLAPEAAALPGELAEPGCSSIVPVTSTL